MYGAIELTALSAAPGDHALPDDDADLAAGVDLEQLECWAEGLVYMDAHARRAPRRMRNHD